MAGSGWPRLVGWPLSAGKSGRGRLARPVQAGAVPPPLPAAARPLGLAPGAMSDWGSYYRGEGPEEEGEEEQEQQDEGTEAAGKGLPALPIPFPPRLSPSPSFPHPPHLLPSRRAAQGPLPSGLGGLGPSRLHLKLSPSVSIADYRVSGRDSLIFLVDASKAMFESDGDEVTPFDMTIQVRLLKKPRGALQTLQALPPCTAMGMAAWLSLCVTCWDWVTVKLE